MNIWKKQFTYDPTLSVLAEVDDIAIKYFFEQDILGNTDIPLKDVWETKPVQSILGNQQKDGSWKYKSKKAWEKMDYDQYYTVLQLADLVEKYGFNNSHPSIDKAFKYLTSHQAKEGDFRGIYANQYSPNYSSMITEQLIKAGYSNNKKVINSLSWLLGTRQDDGGWALAFRTKGQNLGAFDEQRVIEPDKTKPSSWVVTGAALRSLVIHPKFGHKIEVIKACTLLADSFFRPDKYPDRKSTDYWYRFGFPFVYTDLVSALDTLSIAGGYGKHPNVISGLNWLVDHQTKNGLFNIKTTRGNKTDQQLWMALAIYRVFKKLRKIN